MEIDFTNQIIKAKEGKTLNKPFRTPKGPKKFSVYVKNEKGNVVKVNFGDPNMEIKRDDPARRKSFRARHNCDNPGPKTKARYWSCRQWRGGKKVEGAEDSEYEWDGETLFDHNELLTINPELAYVEEEITEECEACEEAEAAHMKPSKDETHDQYMSRCQKAGHSKEECMKSHEGHSFAESEDSSDAALSDKQKKLPPFIQKQILKKKGKNSKDDDKKDDKKEEKSKAELDEKYASLWENIRNKKKRMGKNYKPAKPGDKDYPKQDALKKAQGEPKKKKKKKMSSYSSEYEMTDEEFSEIMTYEELELYKDLEIEESEAAKRPGRKSGAQTPAKPSERKKGSSKNKKGSAGKGGGSITFSAKVIEALKSKVKSHNAKSKKKVTLGQLKKVYRRGAGAFSTSHRPGMTRGGWAMARVNMFLKMKRGGKVKKSYRDADGDI